MRLALLRKIHVSWLIAWFCGGLLGGIAWAYWLKSSFFTGYEWLLVGLALLFIAFTKRLLVMVILAVAAGLLLGLWRGCAEQISLSQYSAFIGQQVSLQGVISEDASYGPDGDQRLMLKDVKLDGRSLPGAVWASTTSAAAVKRSDAVLLQGKLGKGFGSLAASMFSARIVKIERPKQGDLGLQARDRFAAGIRQAIPEPQASLAAGYLVGQRSALPQDLDNQLKIVGLTHAVVASGYNLTILVIFARRLFSRTSKYLATLSAALMIGGFMTISGLSPSMSRAGLVAALSLAAWYYGLRIHPFVLLAVSAAATVLLNPAYLWGDIGWTLSFAAFAGVIILSPLIQNFFWPDRRRAGTLRQILFDTMSAQLATMPIMIYSFGHYSAYALLANLLVLPFIPFTMLLIFSAGLGGLLTPTLAHWVGYPATIILKYMTSVVAWIANLPGAQGNLTFTNSALAASYVALLALVIFLWRKTNYNFAAENSLK